jgi:hypothetical protein
MRRTTASPTIGEEAREIARAMAGPPFATPRLIFGWGPTKCPGHRCGRGLLEAAIELRRPQLLKFVIAEVQPTPWIQTFWIPAMSGARSSAETIICAVNDSSLPSPAR